VRCPPRALWCGPKRVKRKKRDLTVWSNWMSRTYLRMQLDAGRLGASSADVKKATFRIISDPSEKVKGTMPLLHYFVSLFT